MARRAKQPSLSPERIEDRPTRDFARAVTEYLQVWARQRGNPLDGVVTFADLGYGGLVTRGPGKGGPGGWGAMPPGGVPGFIAGGEEPSYVHALTNLEAHGAFLTVVLSWEGVHQAGYSHTNIYRSNTDDYGDAVLVASSVPAVYSDYIGEHRKLYYWVRPVSTSGNEGPLNKTAGTPAETAENPDILKTILEGEIEESQLAQDLATEVDKISGTKAGSVNARIQAEAQDRADAILDAKSDLQAAIDAEKSARETADSAEATSRETLATQLRGGYTGSDIDHVTQGLLYKERKARSDADGSMAADISALQANYNDQQAEIGTKASTTYVNQVKSDAASARATLSNNLTSAYESADSALESAIQQTYETKTHANSARSSLQTTLQSSITDNSKRLLEGGDNLLKGDYDDGDKGGWSGSAHIENVSGQVFSKCVYTSTRDVYGKWFPVTEGERIYCSGYFNTKGTSHNCTFGFETDTTSWKHAVNISSGKGWTWEEGYATVPSGVSKIRPWLQIGARSSYGKFRAARLRMTKETGGDRAARDHIVSVQQTASTNASSINGLEGKYTVKIDNDGYVTGFGLASTSNKDGSPMSEFYVRTDRFAVIEPGKSKSHAKYPFIVSGGKVYMDAALIKSASITNAKIQSLAADKIYASSGTIASALIGSADITSAMIKNAAITSARIASEAVTNSKIKNAAITSAKIKNANITKAKIKDAAVDTLKIKGNAVTAHFTSSHTGQVNIKNSTQVGKISGLSSALADADFVLVVCTFRGRAEATAGGQGSATANAHVTASILSGSTPLFSDSVLMAEDHQVNHGGGAGTVSAGAAVQGGAAFQLVLNRVDVGNTLTLHLKGTEGAYDPWAKNIVLSLVGVNR